MLPKISRTKAYYVIAGLVSIPAGALLLEAVLTLAERNLGNVFGVPLRELAFFANVSFCFYVLFVYFDQRSLRRAESEELRSRLAASNSDRLTGTMMRTPFLDLLRDRLRSAKDRETVFLHADLDFLKQINDAHGHAIGDQALYRLVSLLRQIWPGAAIGRLGGDEFGVLLDEKADPARLDAELMALQRLFSEPVAIGGRSIRISASIGYAKAPTDSPIASELVALADLALYEAKKTRGIAVPFQADMLRDARARRFLVRELRAAILLNQLEVHYQPIMADNGGRLIGYEALVRWNHPVRGLISPVRFVPVAEESTLIDDLGDWVARRVCHDFPALGVEHVSINVSPVQLRNPNFAARFLSIIEAAGLAGSAIIAELTETSLLKAGSCENANLARMRARGVRIAIDDFGTGYASLQYLRKLKIDLVKIDRSYVQGATMDNVDLTFVRAIVSIAKSLDVVILAEGVETEAQMQLMNALGCTLFQGFLLGKPAPLGHWYHAAGEDAPDSLRATA